MNDATFVNDATDPSANLAVVGALWDALGRRDFDAVGALMAPEGHYADVATLGHDPGATGPTQTAARLRLGLAPLSGYELHDGVVVASGDHVVTEHAETWTWEPGISARLPFTSVMQLRDGLVTRWWDYWDLATLLNAAPAWWSEHVAGGYR
jgi:limonene-1,2-epoxide hydrolase